MINFNKIEKIIAFPDVYGVELVTFSSAGQTKLSPPTVRWNSDQRKQSRLHI